MIHQLLEDFHLARYNPDVLPKKSCVYVVFSGKTPIYVGQSRNLRNRHKTHNRKAQFTGKDKSIAWKEVPVSELKVSERLLIKRLQPKLNGTAVDRSMRKITVRLTEDNRIALENYCDVSGRSMTWMFEAMTDLLKNQETADAFLSLVMTARASHTGE